MARNFLPALFLCGLGFVNPALAQPWLVVDVQVTGNSRLPGAAIVNASGLKSGATVSTKEFDAAMGRLDDTGLFTALAYRYDPKTVAGKAGVAVTLQVTEAPVLSSVRLDVPGVQEQEIWQELKRENSLASPELPAREEAARYYKAAIRSALKTLDHDQDIVAKNEVDLATGKRIVTFQSGILPSITGITFEGNRLFSGESLAAAMKRATFLGEGYSERYVRLLLEANIKPLYEERGHLTVTFPHVGMSPASAGVTVAATVDEGPEWTLGKVTLSGEGLPLEEMRQSAKFPEGKIANWTQIQAAIGDANTVLMRIGYLNPATHTMRDYHEDGHVVDLAININKGKQSFFGSLELAGLEPADMPKARALWQLKEGDPMNRPYVDDYLRALGPAIRGIKSFSTEFKARAGSAAVMDVTIKVTMQQK